MHSEKELHEVLTQYANDNRYLLSLGTHKELDNTEAHHAFSIAGYDTAKKLVKIINPHDTAGVLKIPLSKLNACSIELNLAKIK